MGQWEVVTVIFVIFLIIIILLISRKITRRIRFTYSGGSTSTGLKIVSKTRNWNDINISNIERNFYNIVKNKKVIKECKKIGINNFLENIDSRLSKYVWIGGEKLPIINGKDYKKGLMFTTSHKPHFLMFTSNTGIQFHIHFDMTHQDSNIHIVVNRGTDGKAFCCKWGINDNGDVMSKRTWSFLENRSEYGIYIDKVIKDSFYNAICYIATHNIFKQQKEDISQLNKLLSTFAQAYIEYWNRDGKQVKEVDNFPSLNKHICKVKQMYDNVENIKSWLDLKFE